MKKAEHKTPQKKDGDMRPEYDFKRGACGKHCRAVEGGYTITVQKADGTTVVKEVIPKGRKAKGKGP